MLSVQTVRLMLVSLLPLLTSAQYNPYATLRRCYTCRSRGARGDCRDTFIRPSPPPLTPPEEGEEAPYQPAVDETPCSTGWCSKIIEGVGIDGIGGEDYGVATERQCMTRAPSDGKERCAYVKYRNKQVYMCFCKGDLCNSALTKTMSNCLLLGSLLLLGLSVSSTTLWYHYELIWTTSKIYLQLSQIFSLLPRDGRLAPALLSLLTTSAASAWSGLTFPFQR